MPPSVVMLNAAGDPVSVFSCLAPTGVLGVEPTRNRNSKGLGYTKRLNLHVSLHHLILNIYMYHAI